MMNLDDLRKQIGRIEGRNQRFSAVGDGSEEGWQTGYAPLDAALPGQGLPLDACHDFTPEKRTDVAHVAAWLVALLIRLPNKGPIVWCQTAFNAREYGRLYGPGLLDCGLSPERLLFVSVPKERDMPLVLEEALRIGKLAAVVGEGPAPNFTASRRLVLASQASRVPCLILNTSGEIGASAAATRWRVAPIAGPPDPRDEDGPGLPAWSVTLSRTRGGNAALNPTLSGPLSLYWHYETHSFHMVSPLRDGTSLPHRRPAGAPADGNSFTSS